MCIGGKSGSASYIFTIIQNGFWLIKNALQTQQLGGQILVNNEGLWLIIP